MPNVRLHATNFIGSYYNFIRTYISTKNERKHPSRVKRSCFHFLIGCTVQNGRSDFFLLWRKNATAANLNIVKNTIQERKSHLVTNSTKNVTVGYVHVSNIILSCHVIVSHFFFVLKQYVNERENVGEKEHCITLNIELLTREWTPWMKYQLIITNSTVSYN